MFWPLSGFRWQLKAWWAIQSDFCPHSCSVHEHSIGSTVMVAELNTHHDLTSIQPQLCTRSSFKDHLLRSVSSGHSICKGQIQELQCYPVEIQTQSLRWPVKWIQNSYCFSVLIYDQVHPACLDWSQHILYIRYEEQNWWGKKWSHLKAKKIVHSE